MVRHIQEPRLWRGKYVAVFQVQPRSPTTIRNYTISLRGLCQVWHYPHFHVFHANTINCTDSVSDGMKPLSSVMLCSALLLSIFSLASASYIEQRGGIAGVACTTVCPDTTISGIPKYGRTEAGDNVICWVGDLRILKDTPARLSLLTEVRLTLVYSGPFRVHRYQYLHIRQARMSD